MRPRRPNRRCKKAGWPKASIIFKQRPLGPSTQSILPRPRYLANCTWDTFIPTATLILWRVSSACAAITCITRWGLTITGCPLSAWWRKPLRSARRRWGGRHSLRNAWNIPKRPKKNTGLCGSAWGCRWTGVIPTGPSARRRAGLRSILLLSCIAKAWCIAARPRLSGAPNAAPASPRQT